MKIYTIVVYPLSTNSPSFGAALNSTLFKSDPYEKALKENKEIHELIEKIKKIPGIFQLKPPANDDQLPEGFYYAFVNNKISILVTDEKLTPLAQDGLLEKLNEVQNPKELMALIQNPIEAIKSEAERLDEARKIKIAKIQQDLDTTKQTMLQNLDKIINRGEKIEELRSKTESLVQCSRQFKKSSTQLKNRYYCPGLFSIFSTIKNFIWKDGYEYDYRPLQKPK